MFTAAKLYPLLYTQGLWVASRARRLPEPDGPRAGTFGNGPPLRLLILGDSSAAGVGVAHQDQALSGHLSRTLGAEFTVHWTLLAKSGATSGRALEMLDGLVGQFDLVLIALGVNDTKNGARARVWTRNMTTLLNRLVSDHGSRMIGVSGVPPMDRFPLLPNPLRNTLAARARQFNGLLQQITDQIPEALFLRTHLEGLEGDMAEDGFHPGDAIYRQWAREAADHFYANDLRDLVRGDPGADP